MIKPPAFDYIVATDCDTAVAALARAGEEAKILAGGQSLMPMLNFRLLRPSILVDINRIPGLGYIAETPDSVRIGELTRHFELEASPLISQDFPVLSYAVAHVGHLAIRNRGTIGGSLSHADPAAELPMMAVLLDATLRIVSATGRAHRCGARFLSRHPPCLAWAGPRCEPQKQNRSWWVGGLMTTSAGARSKRSAKRSRLKPICTPQPISGGIWPACSPAARLRRPGDAGTRDKSAA